MSMRWSITPSMSIGLLLLWSVGMVVPVSIHSISLEWWPWECKGSLLVLWSARTLEKYLTSNLNFTELLLRVPHSYMYLELDVRNGSFAESPMVWDLLRLCGILLCTCPSEHIWKLFQDTSLLERFPPMVIIAVHVPSTSKIFTLQINRSMIGKRSSAV